MKRLFSSASVGRCCLAFALTTGLGALPAAGQGEATNTSRGSEASRARTDRASTSRGSSSNRAHSTSKTDSGKLDRSDKAFLEKAARSSMKETALSQLAAEKASSPEVREYAQQIVTDHHKVNQQLMRLAQDRNVKLDVPKHTGRTAAAASASGRTRPGQPSGSTTGIDRMRADATGGRSATARGTGSSLDDMNRLALPNDRDYRNLSEESGEDFDQRYVELMVEEHEKAVELFEEAAEGASDEEVRSFASTHVASLRQHLQEAKGLQRAVAE